MVVEATVPGGVAKSENVTVKAGQTASVEITFSAWGDSDAALASEPEPTQKHADEDEKPDKSSGQSRAPMWIAGGVGVAGLATFAVFGILSNSKYKDLDEHCPDGHCYADYKDIGDQGKAFQTVANVGLVVGAVGVATAATLFVIGPSKAKPAEESRMPKLRVGLGSVAVSGSFQ